MRTHILEIREQLGQAHPDNAEQFQSALVSRFNEHDDVRKLIELVRYERPGFNRPIHPHELSNVVYVKPRVLHRRIEIQSGAFLVFGLFSDPKTHLFIEEFEIKEVHVENRRKNSIRKDLERLGITRHKLFPDMDASSEKIREDYSAR